MTRQQVRACVEEYRRRATLVRQFHVRRQVMRGQRGSSIGLHHALAMTELLNGLRQAGHVMLSDMLKAWNSHLESAIRASEPEARQSRAAARKLTAEINVFVDNLPLRFGVGKP